MHSLMPKEVESSHMKGGQSTQSRAEVSHLFHYSRRYRIWRARDAGEKEEECTAVQGVHCSALSQRGQFPHMPATVQGSPW